MYNIILSEGEDADKDKDWDKDKEKDKGKDKNSHGWMVRLQLTADLCVCCLW